MSSFLFCSISSLRFSLSLLSRHHLCATSLVVMVPYFLAVASSRFLMLFAVLLGISVIWASVFFVSFLPGFGYGVSFGYDDAGFVEYYFELISFFDLFLLGVVFGYSDY